MYYKNFYDNLYNTNKSLLKNLSQNYMYRKLTKDIAIDKNLRYLEIGAANGNLAKYLKITNHLYFQLDINYPNKLESSLYGNRFVVGDIQALPIKKQSFDYIILTCVLHHLSNPQLALKILKDKLRKNLDNIVNLNSEGGGIFILIPNDPSFLYKILYRVFSAKHLKRAGVEDPWEHHLNQHLVRKDALYFFIKKTFSDCKINIKKYPKIAPIFRIYKITLR